jgi:hypothetical protein
VHRVTNPFGKSVLLHKDAANLICWKILKTNNYLEVYLVLTCSPAFYLILLCVMTAKGLKS